MSKDIENILEQFEMNVEAKQDCVAIQCGDKQLTYGKFYEIVNSIAAMLIDNGVVNNTIVGVIMPRSIPMVASIFAIMKAGGAYLPISGDIPIQRIEFIARDSQIRLLITEIDGIELAGIKVIKFSDINMSQVEGECKYPTVKGSDLAYVMYTSGSTGEPKGVLIEHASLLNRLMWQQEKYPIGSNDVVLQKTIYTFDVSVWEIFWWAMTGASLYLLENKKEHSPKAIIDSIYNGNVSALHFVPSVFTLFLNYVGIHQCTDKLSSVKYIFLSGEQVSREAVDSFYKLFGSKAVKLINLYGPTETTIDVTFFECENYAEYGRIPIGKPIMNTDIYIIDKDGHSIPDGEVGELYIGGVQVARSYLNRPELTKSKFINLTENSSKKVYRTGDLARKLPDGNIEFRGRMDTQVKLRGMRLELGEIESQMRRLDYITEAVVQVVNGDLLCAFYRGEQPQSPKRINGDLKKFLPSYMIPSKYIFYEVFPLMPNGKIDYSAFKI